jgi:hypothetical protein
MEVDLGYLGHSHVRCGTSDLFASALLEVWETWHRLTVCM